MAIYRVTMQFPRDSALPRDLITVNPHFNGDNADALLGVLQANLQAWPPTSTNPFTLKAYDAAQAPPSFPLATRTVAGTTPVTTIPREIALCLSYYTGFNRPRYRGRLFLPAGWLTTAIGLRPTLQQRDSAIQFATNVLTKTLPQGTNWVVWSKTEHKSMGGVNNVWVDDEWDTVRSRGLKPTTRTLATVP